METSRKNSVDQAVEPERREEREGEHHAAELGEHAGRRDHQLAEQAVRIRPSATAQASSPPMTAPAIAVHDGELDRLDERADERRVREQPA